MELHLADSSPDVAQALASQFRLFPEIDVCCDDILSVGLGAVVSPANGHGYLDGGVDHAYLERFGPDFAGRVRDACNERPEGHLPVGASAIVRTGSLPIEFVIVAPTMVMPRGGPGEPRRAGTRCRPADFGNAAFRDARVLPRTRDRRRPSATRPGGVVDGGVVSTLAQPSARRVSLSGSPNAE